MTKGKTPAPVIEGPSQSAVMVRVGNADFPVITASNCRVCRSPHRLFIENELVRGAGYASIVRQVEGLDGGTGSLGSKPAELISRHYRDGHVPERARTRRIIQERRAEEMGLSILGEENIVTTLSMADSIIQRGNERMLDGELEPDIKDVIAALKLRNDIEKATPKGFDLEIVQQAMQVFWAEVEKRMSPDDMAELGEVLDRHPVLNALRTKMAQAQGQIVAGDVEED